MFRRIGTQHRDGEAQLLGADHAVLSVEHVGGGIVFEFCQRGMAIAKANASQRHGISGVEIFHRAEKAIGEGLANALIGAVHHGVVHAGEKTEEGLDVLRAYGAVGDGQQSFRDGGIGGDGVLPSDLIRG